MGAKKKLEKEFFEHFDLADYQYKSGQINKKDFEKKVKMLNDRYSSELKKMDAITAEYKRKSETKSKGFNEETKEYKSKKTSEKQQKAASRKIRKKAALKEIAEKNFEKSDLAKNRVKNRIYDKQKTKSIMSKVGKTSELTPPKSIARKEALKKMAKKGLTKGGKVLKTITKSGVLKGLGAVGTTIGLPLQQLADKDHPESKYNEPKEAKKRMTREAKKRLLKKKIKSLKYN